jgi:hypothetical protein
VSQAAREERDSGETGNGIYRDAQEAAREIGDFIGEQMSERPYATLFTALGVGYALGLPRGAVALIAGLLSRVAMGQFETLVEEAPSARKRRRSR